jgi:hypothetical protein
MGSVSDLSIGQFLAGAAEDLVIEALNGPCIIFEAEEWERGSKFCCETIGVGRRPQSLEAMAGIAGLS